MPTDESEAKPAKLKRRRFQYSLRGLLLFTALLCMALGWHMNGVWRQRAIIKAVGDAGGECLYDYGPPEERSRAVQWLAEWLGEDHCYNVSVVTFVGVEVDEEVMSQVCRLSHLKSLSMHHRKVTDRHLAYLENATSLEALCLDQTAVTDAGLAHLSRLSNLRFLTLYETGITDAGVAHLSDLKQLDWLCLNFTNISDAALSDIGKLKNLTFLSLDGTRITDRGLPHLKNLRKLQFLDIDCPTVSSAAVEDVFGKDSSIAFSTTMRRLGNHGVAGFRCSGWELKGDPQQPAQKLFDRLMYYDSGTTALSELLEPVEKFDLMRTKGWVASLMYSGVSFIPMKSGRAAVARMQWCGLAPVCGFGTGDGKVEFPIELQLKLLGESFVCFAPDGTPLWKASTSRNSIGIMDIDGDGKAEELVRWSGWFSGETPPFLVIHDLTKPRLPAMLAIALNDLIEDLEDTDKLKSLRVALWQDGGDIVIEEKSQEEFLKRTTFRFVPESRTWDVDSAAAHPCWRKLNNPRVGMSFLDLVEACSFTNLGEELKGDPTRPAQTLLDDLSSKDTASAALRKLLGPTKTKDVLEPPDGMYPRQCVGVCYVRMDTGRGAVARVNRCIERGTQGTEEESRVRSAEELLSGLCGDMWIAFDPNGKYLWHANAKAYTCVMDADGDGRAEELVCWRNGNFGWRYVAIFDLTKRKLPPMLAISFPDKYPWGLDLDDESDDSEEGAEGEPDNLSQESPEENADKSTELPSGLVRWSMPRGATGKFRDIVVEDSESGEFAVRAVFRYDATSRTWKTNAEPDYETCWKFMEDDDIKAVALERMFP